MDTKYLAKQVKKALEAWYKPNSETSPLEELCLFRKIKRTEQFNNRRATNHLLHNALKQLKQDGSRHSEYLELRYPGEKNAIWIADSWGWSEAAIFGIQRVAIARLTDIISEEEAKLRNEQHLRLEARLDTASYVNLVGVEEHCNKLMGQLTANQPPFILALEGIGGIGKTSLAHMLARSVIEQNIFDEIGWVSVRQTQLDQIGQIIPVRSLEHSDADAIVKALIKQIMPDLPLPTQAPLEQATNALHAHLCEHPHLIVIDNLETIENIRDILPTLQRLANPSKLILTSRESLYGEPNVYHFDVPALSEVHALQLIRQEARFSHLPVLANSPDEDLLPIIETVGGNPLALRLVVGLAHKDVLEDILADLVGARSESAENLYTYVYEQAWRRLSALGQQTLVNMPLIGPHGGNLDFLEVVCDMTRGELRKGLDELITLNLVNVNDRGYNQLYHIHSLTRTFLLEQVVRWK